MQEYLFQCVVWKVVTIYRGLSPSVQLYTSFINPTKLLDSVLLFT